MADMPKISFRTPQEDRERREKAEREEKDRKRRLEFQKMTEAQMQSVKEREGELTHIRDRFMYSLLPKCPQGLEPGADTVEALLIVEAVQRVDKLLELCNLRKKFIADRAEKDYTEGKTAFDLQGLFDKMKGQK